MDLIADAAHLIHLTSPGCKLMIWVCLWQIDDTEVINFLLSTEIIPLCLKTMEMGSELSKTVATFIVQKILIDQVKHIKPALPCCLSVE